MKLDIPALKEALRIPEVWQRLGLPGEPKPACRSPFREDRNPSFAIFDDGCRWKDHGTGEAGDVIDFLARACNVDNAEATRRFAAMSGSGAPAQAPPPARSKPGDGPKLPTLRKGSVSEIDALAKMRRLHFDAVSLAVSGDALRFADVCGFPSWILLDDSRKIAEARRLDGRQYPAIGDLAQRKAHTIKGSSKSWPCGVAMLARPRPKFRAVLVVEGGADFLAALHFAITRDVWDVWPVAVLGRGAASRIDPQALELLRGHRIRIYPHSDPDGGGVARAAVWFHQLRAVGCDVDYFTFEGMTRRDGKPVSDLNDAALIDPAQVNELEHLLP